MLCVKHNNTMGRRKIDTTEYIHDEAKRNTTFKNRISGLCNKGKELSSMTGTNVVITITDENGTVLMDKAYDALESRKRPKLLEQEVNTIIPLGRCNESIDSCQISELQPRVTECNTRPVTMVSVQDEVVDLMCNDTPEYFAHAEDETIDLSYLDHIDIPMPSVQSQQDNCNISDLLHL